MSSNTSIRSRTCAENCCPSSRKSVFRLIYHNASDSSATSHTFLLGLRLPIGMDQAGGAAPGVLAPVNKPETSDSILRGRKLNPGFREQAAINCAAVTLLYPRHLLKSVANKELGINKNLGEKRNSLYDDSPAAAWVSRRTSCLLKRRGTCRFNRGENIR